MSVTPQFIRIKASLLAAIEQGDYAPGAQVLSENQLADKHGVSRMTARRALTELVDEGILARSQGAGTFVCDQRPMSSMLTIRGIRDEVLARGHDYQCHVLAQKSVPADSYAASCFGVAEHVSLFHSLILHLENQIPIQLESRLVNPAMAPDYLEQNFTAVTVNQYLNTIAPLTEAEHSVEAVLATAQQAGYLQIAATIPCLQIHRRTYSRRGVVSLARLIHPGNRYRLGGHLHFSPSNKDTL